MRYISLFIILLTLGSCKSINLFQPHCEVVTNGFKILTKDYEHILGPGDKITLGIWGHDELSMGSAYSIYNSNVSFGKWVLIKKDSTATLPYIGVQKIGGLTSLQAEKKIAKLLSKTINKPVVEIKILNREITVLGEVRTPGNYVIEKELNTLIEAIGMAEGINFQGDKKRIKVIRNNVSYTIDLTRMRNLKDKNIYLQAGDIVYVPSEKSKRFESKSSIIIPYASLITALGIIASIVQRE